MSITDNKHNITIWQGSTFGMNITVQNEDGTPQDLTDYSARMQIRTSYRATSAEETLTSSNGEITIDATNGKLSLDLSAARTANITVDLSNGKPPKTTYVYDLELDIGGVVSKILYGDFTVYGEVTR